MSAKSIYLSPHYDDTCFSLGMTAKSTGGCMINLFTQSNHTAAGRGAIDDVSKRRDDEDLAFATSCGLDRHNLGLPDAPVLGRDPFDLSDLDDEVNMIAGKLEPLLQHLLDGCSPAGSEVYVPLAVGRHRNHMSTFLWALRAHASLRPQARVFFYEDLPYANKIHDRKEAIERLIRSFPHNNVVRHANQMTDEEMTEKLALTVLYASQHKNPPTAVKFTPAEPSTPFPHEAFWEAL